MRNILKKSLASVVMTMLLLSQAVPVFADTVAAQEVIKTATVAPVTPEPVVTHTQTATTFTDGFYVDIMFPNGLDKALVDSGLVYFNLSLLDAEGTAISTAVANKENFAGRTFNVLFNVKSFKAGDKFHIVLDKAGDLATKLTFQDDIVIGVHQYAPVVALQREADSNGVTAVDGSKESPITFVSTLPADRALVKTIDSEGKPLANVALTIKDVTNNTNTKVESNSSGVAIIPIYAKSSEMLISLTKDYKGLSLQYADKGIMIGVVHYGDPYISQLTAVLSSFTTAVDAGEASLTVSTTSKVNSELSQTWGAFSLNLKDGEKLQSVTNLKIGDVSTSIPSGAYTLSVIDNPYADIKLASSSLSLATAGKATIKATATPFYTLEISKFASGSSAIPYKFEVINVPSVKGKVFSGTTPTTFAVAPGQAFVLKDADTNKVMAVSISDKKGATRIDLSSGTIKGGSNESPNTGDPIMLALYGLFASLTLLGVALFLLRRKKLNIKSTLTMLLVGTMIASSLSFVAPLNVLAYFDGTTPGDVGGNTKATGRLAYSDGSAGIAHVYPVVNGKDGVKLISINSENVKSSTDSDMESLSIQSYERLGFFIATDVKSNTRWTTNSNVYSTMRRLNGALLLGDTFDGAEGRELDNFRLNYRTLPYAGSNGVIQPNSKLTDIASNKFYTALATALTDQDLCGLDNKAKGSPKNLSGSLNKTLMLCEDSEKAEILQGYMSLIKQLDSKTSLVTPADVKLLQDALDHKNGTSLSFVVKSVVGFYNSAAGVSNTAVTYMDLNNYIDHQISIGETNVPRSKVVNNFRKQAVAVDAIGASNAKTYRFSYKYLAAYAATLKPYATNLVSDGAQYGGWGFFDYSNLPPVNNKPGLSVTLNLTEYNADGTKSDTKIDPIDLESWTASDLVSHPLAKMIVTKQESEITGKNVVVSKGAKYTVMADPAAPFKITDVADNTALDGGTVAVDSKGYKIKLGISSAIEPKDLGQYLDTVKMEENNYFVTTKGLSTTGSPHFNTPPFSNAKLTLELKVMSAPPIGTDIVPQWRLSKYWSQYADPTLYQSAVSELKLSPDANFYPASYISPSGGVNFKLVNPTGLPAWFRSVAKVVPGDMLYKSITHATFSGSVKTEGDLLAIKENIGIDNIKVANWVKNFTNLDQFGIGSTAQGAETTRASDFNKNFIFKYGVDNPYSYTHYMPYYQSTWWGGYWTGWKTEKPVEQNYTADYNETINFKRYKPVATTTPTFAPVEKLENGFMSIAAQSPTPLMVDPEVFMLASDVNGNNTFAYVAGDILRKLSPVSYHTMKYTATVDPTVVGTSVATDLKAQKLAGDLGAGDKPVIYKGSQVNISFDVQGTMTAKSYILDISDSSHKNAWGNKSYDAPAINKAFLSKFGSYDSTSKSWNYTSKATENLKINDKLFGKNVADAKFTNTASDNTYINHDLVIRGGKLVAVDGKYDFKTSMAGSELLAALENMKLTTTETVLSVFDSNKGDLAVEDDYCSLGNAVRGTNDLDASKGFYNEDTTTLDVIEYIQVFKLPISIFTDKIPMTVDDGISTPVNKNNFYLSYDTNKFGGYTGHTIIRYSLWSTQKSFSPYDTTTGTNSKDVFMEHDSSLSSTPFGTKSTQMIVPNVSILDTMN